MKAVRLSRFEAPEVLEIVDPLIRTLVGHSLARQFVAGCQDLLR